MISQAIPISTSPGIPISSNSIRVEFQTLQSSSSGCCSTVPMECKIERRFPPLLQNVFSSMSWNDFCNQVDEAFEPFQRARKISNLLALLSFLVFIILVIVQIVIFVGITTQERNAHLQSIRFVPIFFIIAFVLVFILQCFRACWVTRLWKTTMERINHICTEYNHRYPNLYIRFRNSQYMTTSTHGHHHHTTAFPAYLEFELSSSPNNTVTVDTYSPYISTATTTLASHIPEGKSVAQRMADLESIRSVLSDQEYYQKRNEILSQV